MESTSVHQQPSPTMPKRWPKRLSITIITLLVGLFALPELIRMGAVYWLNQQPDIQQVSLKDVDLNFFTGEVALTGLSLSGDGQSSVKLKKIYLNLKISSLFQQRIDVESLDISELTLDVKQDSQDNTIVAGINLSNNQPSDEHSATKRTEDNPEETSNWGIGIQALAVSDLAINIIRPDLETTLAIDQLRIGEANTWSAENASPINLAMKIHGAPLKMTGHISPFVDQAQAKLQLELQQLPLSLVSLIAAQQGIENLSGALSLKLDIEGIVGGDSNITSSLQLANLTLTQERHDIALKNFKWQGNIQHRTPTAETDMGIRAQGSIGLTELLVNDTTAKVDLFKFSQLDINNLYLKEALEATIEGINMHDIVAVSQAEKKLIQLTEIDLNQLSYDGKTTIHIDSLDLNELVTNIQLNAAGEIALLKTLSTPDTESNTTENTEITKAEEAKPATNEPSWRVKIGQFQVAKNSQLSFTDQSVTPNYNANIQPLELIINDIDTGAPEQDISIKLEAKINELTQLAMDAKVRPFNERINMTAQGEIKNLNMPPLSPYALAASGYYLKRGQADANFEATIVEDKLDSKIHLTLNKFNLKAGDPEKAKTLNDSLSIPLDLALNILRDKQDNIALDIKIDGDINDPQFDASKVINKALGNATKFAAVYVLKQSLQPWGAVYSIGSYLGKKATTPRFDSVVFAAGNNELSEEQRQYIDKLTTLLIERPVLSLNICASASEQDRQALSPPATEPTEENTTNAQSSPNQESTAKEQVATVSNIVLLELASARMNAVKKLLINKGVDAGRLFTCQPTIDNIEKAEPVVELFL